MNNNNKKSWEICLYSLSPHHLLSHFLYLCLSTTSFCQSLQFAYPSYENSFPFWTLSLLNCPKRSLVHSNFQGYVVWKTRGGLLSFGTNNIWILASWHTWSNQFLLPVSNMIPRKLWAPHNHHFLLSSSNILYDNNQQISLSWEFYISLSVPRSSLSHMTRLSYFYAYLRPSTVIQKGPTFCSVLFPHPVIFPVEFHLIFIFFFLSTKRK